MNTQIRWGILSTANIGRARVVPAMQKSSNGRVAAVASRALEKAQKYAQELNIPTAYGSYEELLADPNIDAIYIPLPNSEHAAWSIRCAEAGKPVLCEKPLAADAAEAQKMVDTFAAKQILFAEAFMYRFHPQTQRVKEMITNGAIGDVQVMDATFTFPVQNEDDVRLQKTLAGGALMDVGCYCVNVMRFMFGEEPIEAKAIARFRDVDERLVGILGFPSGGIGHFNCSLRTHLTHRYEIRGSQGRIVVDEAFSLRPDQSLTLHHWQDDQHHTITIDPANHYQLMVEDFADALLNKRPPRFSAEDGVRNLQVTDWLLLSATV